MYAVGQLCIRTMYFSINDRTAYVICSIYSIPVFPYLVKFRCQLWHFSHNSWRMIIYMTSFNVVWKYEIRIFHFLGTLNMINTRLAFSIHFFLDFTTHTRSIFKMFTSMNLRNGSFLKRLNKLAVCVLSGIKHSTIALCSKPDNTLLLVF